MKQEGQVNSSGEPIKSFAGCRRHPMTQEHSPEETIKRLRSLPERAAKLREALRGFREANAR